MRELDDNDPRLIAAADLLLEALQPFVGQHFDAGRLDEVCDLVQQHRIAFRRAYDADFPPLVPFVLPSIRFIHFVRADIDDREIRIQLRNLLVQLSRRGPGVLPPAIEIVRAVKQCWPRYQPPVEEFRADPLMRQRLN
jgi:hypothetical protein